MRSRFSLLTAVCAVLFCGGVAAAPQCSSREQVEASLKPLIDRLDSVGKAQREQGERVKGIAMEKARAKNWDAAKLRGEVQRYLTSPEYLAMEKERVPHQQQIVEAITLLRTGLQQGKQSQVERQFCMDRERLMEAIEASFAINTREVALGAKFFSVEK
ncbi:MULTISPECIES: hypothetical protein [Delftia]|uniref:hypothetical protein n=1 Tax=Delftia TaxID=80865 RepID=UPI0012ED724A|nr:MULTISPECIES: hypothetical protein [Delftia]MCP4018123.1 hypothetical protein [Delftia sp.]MCP4529664.1 hypothetical protein [Delftia sp.]QPS74529.1 hypothetical protein I6G48_28610 [Delftia acidovorans]